MRIRIITDTMCDVPAKYAEQYNIKVMPLTVHFGEKAYRDGVDLRMEDFYRLLGTCEELPTTSQVTPMAFSSVYEEELAQGNQIIVINASSSMSGTHNSALLAKNNFESKDIHVIDSQGITMGPGILVIKAARMAEAGVDVETIVNTIEESKGKLRHYFIVDTLKYLQKGGRISLSASVLGAILNIKPILTVKDGKLEFLDKARGTKKAISMILDIIHENNWDLNHKIIGINHTMAPESADLFEEIIREEFNVEEVIKGEVGSVVATHAGPGAIALYFEI
jgi:DegV family protein with EDD domain